MSVPLPRSAEVDEPGDAELIAAVRSGDIDAYGLLYRRHSGSALALARHLTGSRSEADDLVAESFAKVLDVLRGGRGPDSAFRAYLLTTLRHTLYDRARRDRRVELSDDMTRHDPGVPWEDTAVAGLDSALAARAFHKLPERWQTVLWHTEVEQESPAEVAPLLGLTPNGVAALAYRAREGLRQAYLQEHLTDGVAGAHLTTVNRLGAWARGGLSVRQRAKVDAHLAVCETCSRLAAELEDVNGGLRGIIAPLVLGTGAAAYLAAHGGVGAGVATAAAAEAAGGAIAGAAAGGAGGAAGAAGAGTAAAGGAGGAAAGAAGAAGTAAAGGAGGAAAGGAAGAAAGTAAASGAAGTAAAGGAAAGEAAAAGTAAAGTAGTAAAGTAASTAAAGTTAGAGTTAAAGTGAAGGSGSMISSVTAWVAGTHVGQAVAATAAAVVIGGTTAIVTHDGGGSTDTGRAVVAAASSSANGLPGPNEQVPTPAPTGTGTVSGGPTAAPSGGGTASPTAGPTGGASPSGGPGLPLPTGRPTGSGGAPPSSLPVPPPPPSPGVTPVLVAAQASPLGVLKRGSTADLAVSIRNTGRGGADDLVATVRLPAGFATRSGSGSNGWDCTGTGRVATCTRDELDAGDRTTLHVRADIGRDAPLAGTADGTVAAGDVTTPIPPAVLAILP
jgi:RNA polymerase sigma factor (sigma-70 family)